MANVKENVSSDMIKALREQFLNHLEENKELELHPSDIERAKLDDLWIARFLFHQDLDLNNSLKMLLETCRWRKEFGVNDITRQAVLAEYFEKPLLYSHNRDKENHKLLIFCAKSHFKNTETFEDLKKYVLYWVEKLEKEEKGERISLFFDMTDSGYANMDTEFVKYIIHICKSYYPSLLAYIFVFELPWILKAAWKIISSWLPSKAANKIIFINKTTISEYIDSNQQLKSWGGTDSFIYGPEIVTHDPVELDPQMETQGEEDIKKVQFQLPTINIAEDHKILPSKSKYTGDERILSVQPEDELEFDVKDDDITASMTLTNKTDDPVSFKVKTTKPDKFRVRPNAKVLAPHEIFTVTVTISKQYTLTNLGEDKFLIMAATMSDVGDVSDFWKAVSPNRIQEYRLKSKPKKGLKLPDAPLGVELGRSPGDLSGKIDKLVRICNRIEHEQTSLNAQLNYLTKQLVFIVIAVLVVIIALHFKGSDPQSCKSPSISISEHLSENSSE